MCREPIRILSFPSNDPIVTHDDGFVRVTHTFDGTLLSCRELNRFVGKALDWLLGAQLV